MKTLTIKSFAFAIASMTLGLGVQAAQLKDLRPQYNLSNSEKSTLEAASAKRTQKLRSLLNTSNLKFTASYDGTINVKRSLTTSVYVKSILSDVSKAFKNQESYDKPLTFDPSAFESEIDRSVLSRKNNLCKTIIGKSKKDLIDQIYDMSYQARNSTAANRSAEVKNASSELADALNQYIGADALKKLGKIHQIEIVDGKVTRIHFSHSKKLKTNPSVALPDSESLALSLEMLSTIVSGYDQFFIDGNRCLVDLLKAESFAVGNKIKKIESGYAYRFTGYGKNDLKALRSNQFKFEAAYDFMLQKYAGARFAHLIVGQLTQKQIHVLLDLFLQLRGKDIPTSDDVRGLKTLAGQGSSNALKVDTLYYSNLEEELYRAEEYIREYNRTSKVNNQIISEIKGGN